VSVYLSSELRERLIASDNQHCAYCHTRAIITGQPTVFENLCFCCRRCNEFKGNKTKSQDPLTGENLPLYNPRQQKWGEHFEWDETGTFIIGLTAIGRCTIVRLNMNDTIMVSARRRWVSVGWHPPEM